jgi:hypothetical protein
MKVFIAIGTSDDATRVSLQTKIPEGLCASNTSRKRPVAQEGVLINIPSATRI